MAETTESQETKNQDQKMNLPPPSFSIWPPTQRTRDAVISRLVETLSSPSVLSKRYGTLSHHDSLSVAQAIEAEAFSSASTTASPDDDGIEILQLYSKEISKRMLEAVKSRSLSASADNTNNNDAVSEAPTEAAPVTPSEDISSVVSES